MRDWLDPDGKTDLVSVKEGILKDDASALILFLFSATDSDQTQDRT